MTVSDSIECTRDFATRVVRRLRDAGFTAYWAGGCVRDLLLNQTPKDFDVATDARPEAVQEVFGHKYSRAVGAAFGVILIRGPRDSGDVEVATFRSEGPYLDGRRPEHVVFCTPEEDAQRRDFTINGMFFDPLNQQVLDFVGGQEDLRNRVVRAIGNPQERFKEDKLRLLRAIRFTAALDFQLDPATADAIRLMSAQVSVVSAERIAQEWRRMLTHPRRAAAVEWARRTDLLSRIFPETAPMLFENTVESQELWKQSAEAVDSLNQPRFEVALSTWLADVPEYDANSAEQLCRRLKLSNDELDRIVWLRSNRDALVGARSFPLAKLKRLLAHPYFLDLLSQTCARLIAQKKVQELMDVEFSEHFWRSTPKDQIDPPLLVTGDDLIRSGLKPGKHFKYLLDQVRDAQLDGKIASLSEGLLLAQTLARELH